MIKDEIVCPLDTAILTLQLSMQINKAERIKWSVETKNVVRTEKKNTKMEFEAQAAVICGLIVTLLMLDFETLKKTVGKLTHYAIFRSVNLLKCGFLKKSFIMNAPSNISSSLFGGFDKATPSKSDD